MKILRRSSYDHRKYVVRRGTYDAFELLFSAAYIPILRGLRVQVLVPRNGTVKEKFSQSTNI